MLEQALEAEGISPVVISTPAAAAGAAPFHHEGVVVFKLHGDYLDPDSMLVTEDELATYDPAMARRLASTLEDYGLVACGWSSEWDPALRDAVTAATARRYPLYFAGVSRPASLARALVKARHGVEVEIEDANTFFTALARRVAAIDALNEPHPLDTAALVAAVKQALPRPERRIELEDLVGGSAQTIGDALVDGETYPQNRAGNELAWTKALIEQVARVLVSVRPVAEVLAACAAWGEPAHSPVTSRAMTRLAVGFEPAPGTFQDNLVGLRRLPALLCLYAAGMAAVSRENYTQLKALCVDPSCSLDNGRGRVALISQLNVHSVMPNRTLADAVARLHAESGELAEDRVQATLQDGRKYYAPVAQFLKEWASELSRPYVTEQEAAPTFQRLEILLDLIAVHEDSATEHFTYGASFGLYANRTYGAGPEAKLLDELQAEGDSWGPVAAGLFGGSATNAAKAFETLQTDLDQVRQQRW